MPDDLINTLLLLGAGQGCFLAAVLASRRTNPAANKLLAVAMAAFSLYIFLQVYFARQYYLAFPHLIGAAGPLLFLFGPLHYLYTRTVSRGAESLRTTALLHFVPFLLVLLYHVPFYAMDGASKLAFLDRIMREGLPRDVALIEHLVFPHGLLYVFLTFRLLRRHRERLRDNFSSVEHISLRWLQDLTAGIAAVWLLATTLHLLDLAGIAVGLESSLTPLAVSFLVYGVGYRALSQPEIFHGPAARRPEGAGGAEARPPRVAAPGAPAEGSGAAGMEDRPADREGYEKSGLTPAQAAALMERLRRIMEDEQPFRRSELTLQELADAMSISAHNLSEVINTRAGKNFYDFVNGYRVEEVMRRLRDSRFDHLTILALAVEAGFNSKSTFNAFFRRHTGLTPSQYRAESRAVA